MEYQQQEPGFKSDLMWSMDNAIAGMEQQIRDLKAERNQLKDEVHRLTMEDFHRSQKEFNSFIGNALLACIGQPSPQSIGAAGITMLSRIRDMKTIKQVHAYVDEFYAEGKAQIEAAAQ
jgi:hypothetical protein